MEARNEPLYKAILKLLSKGEHWRVTQVLNNVHPADAAEIIEALPDEEKRHLFEVWDADRSADALLEMDDEEQVEIAETLRLAVIAGILNEMPVDDAVDLIGDLPHERAVRIMERMNPEQRVEVKRLLEHREDTAGGLMTSEFVSLNKEMTAEQAIDWLRRVRPAADETYYIFVVDNEEKLAGVISLRDLIIAEPAARIKNIMNKNVIYVGTTTDQEEAARIIRKYDLLALPVVDLEDKLVGMVTVDDIIDVIQHEATEDMYRMVGLASDERVITPLFISLKRRLPWLYINLVTALVAASVVSLFESTIAKLATLAVMMPIVAGMGGNAGSQTLTIIVRSIALGEISKDTARKALIKEATLGLLNGMAIGIVIAVITYVWQGNMVLGLVIGLAMIFNLVAAASAGFLVPLGLRFFGVDPAVASAIFVTTVTDICGFFFFLGLATIFLSFLI